MGQLYRLKSLLLSTALLLAGTSHAQSPAPDSVQRPPTLLLKAGLRLTHLRYAHDSQAWQFLLPLSLGAEYRVASRLSCYTQLEADLLASSTSGRRVAQRHAVSAASVALGVRYYYGRTPQRVPPAFGRYLALEGSADWQQLPAARWVITSGGRRRTTPSVLTPGIYALWGVQHRLRRHALYDISAGAGLLAPAYYNFERPGAATHWNVGGQATVRLYFAL